LSALFTVIRVVVFEKFSSVFFFFYLVSVLSISFIVSVFHWGIAVVSLLLGLFLFTRFLNMFQFLKRYLIHKNDKVEYADPSSTETSDIFKKAKIVLRMSYKEAKKSALLSDELMLDSKYFYLIEEDKKTKLIAYEWIISLAPDILE
jgi:hypothetical protein